MNLDLCNADVDADIELYFNTFLCSNFESHINKPTRIQYKPNSLMVHSATIIDHIFSNLSNHRCTAANLHYPDSDHFANMLIVDNILQRKRNRQPQPPVYKRNLTNIDLDKLYSDFDCIDWANTVCSDSIDAETSASNTIDHLTTLCDQHAPCTKYLNAKPYTSSNPGLLNLFTKKYVKKTSSMKKRIKIPQRIIKKYLEQQEMHATAC